MGERYLTMVEIEKLYPSEWVLIDKPTSMKRRPETVTGGVVVLHSPDRAAIDDKLRSLRDDELLEFACLYIGDPPEEESADALWFKYET